MATVNNGYRDANKLNQRVGTTIDKGGNLAFFLGPEIQASFYNDVLHTQNNGLFPVMIELRPTDPLPPEERQRRLQNDPGNKILYRDKSHPIVREAFALNENLHLVVIDRYHELRPRSQWVPDAQKETVEVLTLPSKATVNGTGTFNNSGGTTRFSEADMKAWARLAAELHAESQCASGQIRQKHLLVTESSYWLGTDRKSQHSRVSIRTKCW